MMTNASVLVAHDFSDRSERAAQRAFQLAGEKQWSVHAVHVVDEAFPESKWLTEEQASADGSIVDRLKQAVVRRLDDELSGLGAEYGAPLKSHAAFGYVAEQLHALADKNSADLLVVGAHGRHMLKDLFLGATAEQLLWYVNVPTLVVRNDRSEAYRQILVAADFTAETETALSRVSSWFPDARVRVVHVVDSRSLERLQDAGLSWAAMEKERDESAQAQLEEMVTNAGLDPDQVEMLVLHGHPVEEIRKQVDDMGADLVVMGGRGHSRLANWVPGRVASRLVHQLPCDVMLARGR